MTLATAPCPRCGEPVDDHRFCEGCGQDLWVRRTSPVRALDGPCPGCGTARDADGHAHCGTCGLRLPEGADRVEADLDLLGGVSDRGLVHSRNEDAMALGALVAPPPQALVAAVVCDGVSTVDSPERAARAGADAALDRLLHPSGPSMREAVARAAAAVAALADGNLRTAPSCTLVAASVRRPAGGPAEITVGWVGDSRAYWLAAPDAREPARLLTLDHSWAGEVVAAGTLDEAAAMADPRAHAITRWLGADGEPVPDVVTVRPAGPGLLLLCSDGLWNYRPDAAQLAGIALPVLAHAGPLGAARALTAVALAAGGRDNVTVVAVPIEPATEARSPS